LAKASIVTRRFLDEFEETIELIETTGVLGISYEVKGQRPVYRLLMKKSEYHVYLVRKSDDLVIVVAIWSARRKRGSRL
jgi:plasmid stabilization system protein ParE